MNHEDTTARSRQPPEASQLAELLACEQELAALLDEARRDARELVESARVDAERAAADLEASLEEEAEQERERIRTDAQARIRELVTGARERSERFEGLSDERVEALAEVAFRLLLSHEASP